MKRLVFHERGPPFARHFRPCSTAPLSSSLRIRRGMINTATGELQVYCFPAVPTYGSPLFSLLFPSSFPRRAKAASFDLLFFPRNRRQAFPPFEMKFLLKTLG